MTNALNNSATPQVNLRQLLAGSQLPALPQSAVRLLELSQQSEHHQEIDRWAAQPRAEPGRLAVALSALLPTIADPAWHECRLFEQYYEQIVPTSSPDVVEMLGTIDQEFAAFAPLLKVTMPAKSLVDCFNEAAAAVAAA